MALSRSYYDLSSELLCSVSELFLLSLGVVLAQSRSCYDLGSELL
jgi:hypothetical protein